MPASRNSNFIRFLVIAIVSMIAIAGVSFVFLFGSNSKVVVLSWKSADTSVQLGMNSNETIGSMFKDTIGDDQAILEVLIQLNGVKVFEERFRSSTSLGFVDNQKFSLVENGNSRTAFVGCILQDIPISAAKSDGYVTVFEWEPRSRAKRFGNTASIHKSSLGVNGIKSDRQIVRLYFAIPKNWNSLSLEMEGIGSATLAADAKDKNINIDWRTLDSM